MGKITVLTDSEASSGGAVAPGDVTAITCSATIDPQSGQVTAIVSVTPPSSLGTFVGCDIYFEIPDQSAGSPNTVGVAPVGTVPTGGAFNPISVGKQPYNGEPWTIIFQAPTSVNWTTSIPCRIDCPSYSSQITNTLVQANQSGPSPSETFTLQPTVEAQLSTLVNSTAQTTNYIVVGNLGNVSVGGKLYTAFEVIVGSVPNIPNYVYRLVATLYSTDPTQAKNQHVLTGALTQPGFVHSGGGDGIVNLDHSFSLATPTTTQNWVLWMQSGTNKNGTITWSPIVPGVTPSFPFSLGSVSGTLDAAALKTTSIASYFNVSSGILAIATDGITIQNTGGQLALVPGGIDAGVYILNGSIVNANIGSTQIQDGNIVSLNAGKVNFGTLTGIAITAVSITSSTLASTAITGSTLVLTLGGITTSINNTTGSSGLITSLISSGGGASNPQVEVTTQGVYGFYNSSQQWSITTDVGIGGGGILHLAGPAAITIGSSTGFTGTLAAAITAGKSVAAGIILT